MIFVTSSTSSASVKYFWVWVKLYRINTLTTLLEGKSVKIIKPKMDLIAKSIKQEGKGM